MLNWKPTAAFVTFLAGLWLPLIGMVVGVGSYSPSDENRTAAPFPRLTANVASWLNVGAAFTAYVHDHFGFRRQLTTANALFKVRVLGVSTAPDILIGKEGWLFYLGEHAMDASRGLPPVPPVDPALWVDLFDRRRDRLAGQGISTLVVIAPDKQSIYPEFLPSSSIQDKPGGLLDRFLQAAKQKPRLAVLDLRGALLVAKGKGLRVYHQTDTHWNGYGAYAGYTAILAALGLSAPTLDEADYVPIEGSGDIVRMLGLGGLWRERMIIANPRNVPGVAKAGKLLVVGDSFAAPLVPLLTQRFETTLSVPSSNFTLDSVAEMHPDLVIFEMVERRLNDAPPKQ